MSGDKNFKNLLLELSEIEEEIISEFCAGNRLLQQEQRDDHGRQIVIISDSGYNVSTVKVSTQNEKRVLSVDISLEENKQETKTATDVNELIKILLFIQNELKK